MDLRKKMICRCQVAEYPFEFYTCAFRKNREAIKKKSKKIDYLDDINANIWIMPKKYLDEYNFKKVSIKKPTKIKDGRPHDIFFLRRPFIKKVLYKDYNKS